jgi:hypothetical protein
MATLTLALELTDAQATGIAQARTAYNATLPEESTPLTDTEYLQYVLLNAANSYAAQYSGAEPVPPSPVEPVADWEALKNRALGGDLYPIFQRLTLASLATDANTISTARGDITDAILTVKVEAALASGFQLLTQVGGYVFTTEEKALWKAAVDELNFTSLVYLP